MSYVLDETIAAIAAQAQKVLGVASAPVVEPANPRFGADVAVPTFAYARELGKNPPDIAADLAQKLQHSSIAKAEAVSGFVNIWLADEAVNRALAVATKLKQEFGHHATKAGQQIVIEHTDPNPFKEFHIGHAYSNTVGEALARLYAAAGAEVHQVSYHGDVGKHIAMALWGIQQMLSAPETDWFDNEAAGDLTLADVDEAKRTAFLGAAYAKGVTAYKEDEAAKTAIEAINRHLYAHDQQDLQELYETGRAWSFEYFESIYAQLHTSFEKNYFESDAGPEGLKIVRDHI